MRIEMRQSFLAGVLMAATLLLHSQFSCAEQYDDPQCFAKCEDNYNKCIAGVINLPEPRTAEEQQTLDTCQQTHGDCQHSCEESNKPYEAPTKEEDK